MIMENQGLNNDVSVGERKFHVQTHFSGDKKQIISQVFHEGLLIDAREVPACDENSDSQASQQLKEVHQELITEIEILYYIYEKVKAVRHAPSCNKLGLVFLQKKLTREALEQFRLALELDPTFSEVWGNLGRALIMEGSYAEAVEILCKGVAQAPDYADIRNFLGIAYLYNEDKESAVEQFERAIELNANYIGAHFFLGIALLATCLNEGESEESTSRDARDRALSAFEIASRRLVNRQIVVFDEVMQLIKNEEYAEAVAKVLLCQPGEMLSQFTSMENEFYLKFMYGGKGKDDQYISTYVENLQQVLQQHPDYADIHNNLGVVNLIQCRNLFLQALEEFRTALKINPDFKKAEKNLKLAENDGKGFLILLRAILK